MAGNDQSPTNMPPPGDKARALRKALSESQQRPQTERMLQKRQQQARAQNSAPNREPQTGTGQQSPSHGENRQISDRRQSTGAGYTGPERRAGDRRQASEAGDYNGPERRRGEQRSAANNAGYSDLERRRAEPDRDSAPNDSRRGAALNMRSAQSRLTEADDNRVSTSSTSGATDPANPEIRDRLRDLEFVDIYIPLHRGGVPRYNPKNVRIGEPGNVPLDRAYSGDIASLRTKLNETDKEDFSVVHDGIRYRGSRARLANGEHWVCLRRISSHVPTLEQLRIDPLLLAPLRDMGYRHGLIIVCGGTGQGKSTTANAILADYLNRLGHVAMTIEDPVEFNLAGERGNGGYCFQVEVEDDQSWAPALKRALRWHPRYMLVGEIRSGAAAAQVLRAATSGHLVITTLHAGSVDKGIQAMIQIAENEIGPRAVELVAEGISAVLHQTLTPDGPDISFLFTDPSGTDSARQYIRTGKLHMLNSFMEQQALRMAAEASGKSLDQDERGGGRGR